eukprot:c18720_g1_i1.p1 GENE.c18720_g1_i1~~c18720_g1_i1.p1  ORF type:complete len:505 (+),score=174.95 c18720_g1_i1:64-1515(+)
MDHIIHLVIVVLFIVFQQCDCKEEKPPHLITPQVKQAFNEAVKVGKDWLKEHDELVPLLEYCFDDKNENGCDKKNLLLQTKKSFTDFLHQKGLTPNEISKILSKGKVESNPLNNLHFHGTHPAPLDLVGGRVILGEERFKHKYGEVWAILWAGFLFVISSVTSRSVYHANELENERLFYSDAAQTDLVFGETFYIKLQRWKAIHAVFPDFNSWVDVFRNSNAGVEKWGSSSRICMDWLPYMFKDYSDSKSVKNFFTSNNWKDTRSIFAPNLNLLKVQAMRKAGTFDQYVRYLNGLEQKVKDFFFNSNKDDIEMKKERLKYVFEKMDGRDNTDIDIHAAEYSLPTEYLKNCWTIMETALETQIKPKVTGLSGIMKKIVKAIELIATVGEVAIGIYMFTELGGNWAYDSDSFCSPFISSGAAIDLYSGDFYCSAGYRQYSVCWLLCGETVFQPNNNLPTIFSQCQSGQWTNKIGCGANHTRIPYS